MLVSEQKARPGAVEQNDALCLSENLGWDSLTRFSLHSFEPVGQVADSLIQIIPFRAQPRGGEAEE